MWCSASFCASVTGSRGLYTHWCCCCWVAKCMPVDKIVLTGCGVHWVVVCEMVVRCMRPVMSAINARTLLSITSLSLFFFSVFALPSFSFTVLSVFTAAVKYSQSKCSSSNKSCMTSGRHSLTCHISMELFSIFASFARPSASSAHMTCVQACTPLFILMVPMLSSASSSSSNSFS